LHSSEITCSGVAVFAVLRSKSNAFPVSTVIIEQYRPPIDKFIVGEYTFDRCFFAFFADFPQNFLPVWSTKVKQSNKLQSENFMKKLVILLAKSFRSVQLLSATLV